MRWKLNKLEKNRVSKLMRTQFLIELSPTRLTIGNEKQ